MKSIFVLCVGVVATITIAAEISPFKGTYPGPADSIGEPTSILVEEVERADSSSQLHFSGSVSAKELDDVIRHDNLLNVAMCGLAKHRGKEHFYPERISADPIRYRVNFVARSRLPETSDLPGEISFRTPISAMSLNGWPCTTLEP